MEKHRFVRWLIKKEGESITIEERIVSRHMPVNRMLEEVGFYPYDFLKVENHVYLYTFYKDEMHSPKTAIFIGRFEKDKNGLIMSDMSEADKKHLPYIKEKLFNLYNN